MLCLSIVYYEFPDTELIIERHTSKTIPCSIKAPTTATVGWTLNSIVLPVAEGNRTTTCNSTVVTRQVEPTDEDDGTYALHTATLHLCNVNDTNTYACVVIKDDEIVAKLSASIVITEPAVQTPAANMTKLTSTSDGSTGVTIIFVACMVPLVLCVVVLITVTILVMAVRKFRAPLYTEDVGKTKFHMNGNIYQDVTDSMKWECPRDSLSYLRELGSGRFGRVYLAKLKTESKEKTVAVKTLKSSKQTS